MGEVTLVGYRRHNLTTPAPTKQHHQWAPVRKTENNSDLICTLMSLILCTVDARGSNLNVVVNVLVCGKGFKTSLGSMVAHLWVDGIGSLLSVPPPEL